MTSIKRLFYLVFIFTLIIITGCGPTQEQISTQTATAQTAIAALWTPISSPTATPPPKPTLTPTPRETPAIAPSLNPDQGKATLFAIEDISFSLIVPEDWTTSTDLTSVELYGPVIGGIQPSLTFRLDQFSLGDTPMNADWMGISMFSAFVQDTITDQVQNPVMVSEGLIEDPGGMIYFRWIMEHKTNGREYHHAFYIFGSGKWFLTGMYSRGKSGGSEMDALIDDTMKTLKFEN